MNTTQSSRVGLRCLLLSMVALVATGRGAVAGPAGQIDQSPDPYALYSASVQAMRAAQALGKPAYLAYKLSCDTHNLEIRSSKTAQGEAVMEILLVHANHHYDYQAWYRTSDDRGMLQDASTHELFKGALFAPTTIAIDPAKRGPAPGSSAAPVAVVVPPSLGKIDVHASKDYTITYQGLDALDGKDAYHLHLTALHSDRDHPLTDLWIDPATFLIRKASAAATGRAVVAGGGGSGDVLFSQVGKHWMATGFDVHIAAYALLWHANMGMNVRATDIVLPTTLPDAYFTKDGK